MSEYTITYKDDMTLKRSIDMKQPATKGLVIGAAITILTGVFIALIVAYIHFQINIPSEFIKIQHRQDKEDKELSNIHVEISNTHASVQQVEQRSDAKHEETKKALYDINKNIKENSDLLHEINGEMRRGRNNIGFSSGK